MIGIILGIENNSYINKETGELKESKKVYVLWERQAIPDKNLQGNSCSVENLSVSSLPEGVVVGAKCDFVYDIRPTSKGTFARLANIIPLSLVRVSFESIKK